MENSLVDLHELETFKQRVFEAYNSLDAFDATESNLIEDLSTSKNVLENLESERIGLQQQVP